MTRRAVFLDRDGVLVRGQMHGPFFHSALSLDDFVLMQGIAEPICQMREAGFLMVLATNQPAIARGLLSWETLNEMHRRLQKVAPLDAIQVCPHTDADGCGCRKPKPGLLLGVPGVELKKSFFIGDTWRDVAAGLQAGVTPILIDAPYNRDFTVSYRVRDLAEAARLILGM